MGKLNLRRMGCATLLVAMLPASQCNATALEAEPPGGAVALPAAQQAFSPEAETLLHEYRWRDERTDYLAAFRDLRLRLIDAINHHPSLLAQWAQEQERVLRIDEVRAERRPQVNVGFEQRNSLEGVNRNAFDSGSRLDAVVTVSQLLYDFGASGQRLEAAHLEAEAEQWNSQVQGEELVMSAITAHFEVMRHTALSVLADDNIRQHERILADVAERAAGGAGTRSEVLRAESRLAEARARRVSIQGQLARATNHYQEVFLKPPGELRLPRLMPLRSLDADQALEEALESNAGLRRSLLLSESSQAEASAARSSQYPRFSANLQGRQFDIDQPSVSESDVTLMFQVDYSPYTGGRASSRAAQAVQRAERMIHEREALLRNLEARLRSAFSDLEARRELLQAQSLTLEAEQQSLVAYRAQFGIGRRSLSDLLDAQRDLFQSGTAVIESRIEWELSRFYLLAVTGQLLPTLEIEVRPQGSSE
ncbi:TolC family protein [Halomonas mongoliensis]|uniref:TolC family protein n=1 Tax=Halomonas mongoliensis TaxID=321265 RepID=UPI00403A856B